MVGATVRSALGGSAGLLAGEIILWLSGGGLIARAFAWSLLGLGVGAGIGSTQGSRLQLAYACIGGVGGGFAGGATFEWLRATLGAYEISQALGLMAIGACIGALIIVVEKTLRAAWLMVITGDREGREFTISKSAVVIGCARDCDFVIPRDGTTLGAHARILRSPRGYWLEPLPGAERKVAINNVPVARPTLLNNKDRIGLGRTKLLFRTRAARPVQ
jgi:hypothetical protein